MSSTDLLTDEEGKFIYNSKDVSVNLYQVQSLLPRPQLISQVSRLTYFWKSKWVGEPD